MTRKRQICIRLTEEEFERVQSLGSSPRDILLQACLKLADPISDILQNQSVQMNDTEDISANIDNLRDQDNTLDMKTVEGLKEKISGLEIELSEVKGERDFWLNEDTAKDKALEQLQSEIEELRSRCNREVIRAQLDAVQKAFDNSKHSFSIHYSEFGSNLRELGFDWNKLADLVRSDISDSLFKGKSEKRISELDIERAAEGLEITSEELARHRTPLAYSTT